jgi:hypothetical protein
MTIADGQLFFSELHLPSLRLDESLYSWCARFHRLNLGHDPIASSRMLFGHPNAGLHHGIPFALAEFENRTRGHLGRAIETLTQRTIFGFHAKFLPQDVEIEIGQLFVGLDYSLGLSKLGLKKVGRTCSDGLRHCPACAREQRAQYSHTWWLLSHQLPTSLVCLKHQLPLETSPVQQYRGAARDFHLPNLAMNTVTGDSRSGEVGHRLMQVTEWGLRIHGQNRMRLTDAALRWCYRLQAKERKWVAFDGSLRMQELRDAFVNHYDKALEHFGIDIFGELSGVNGGFLAYLLRQAPSRRHPLKHVLLLNFLFECFEQFEEVFREVLLTLDSDGPAGCEKRLRDSQAMLLRLVQDGGQSLSKAAPTIGISPVTAARFLDSHGGVQRDRRPHIIRTEKEVMLRTLLEQGISRKEITEKAGVRRKFITDYLATRSSLKAEWEHAHWAKVREKRRAQLLSALKAHPDMPIKTIRRLPQNGFQWLYNNDRDWLIEVLPAIWKR